MAHNFWVTSHLKLFRDAFDVALQGIASGWQQIATEF
jgi:hypothetical protein